MKPDLPDSPWLLALNAAEGLLQIAIIRREQDGAHTLACTQFWHAPSQGAELLAPALADALDRLHTTPQAIGGIAAVRGPGSFTGLRLVLSTTSGLARATGALRAGLDYLPLLAASALHALPAACAPAAGKRERPNTPARPRRVWVLTHARRNLVHMQGFEEDPALSAAGTAVDGEASAPGREALRSAAPCPARLRPLCGILVCAPEEAARCLARFAPEETGAGNGGSPPLVLGSGLTRNREAFVAALMENEHRMPPGASGKMEPVAPLLLPPSFDHPSAGALLLAATNTVYSTADPAPLYVRPPDAVDALERIAASLGIDPDEAKKRLAELTK